MQIHEAIATFGLSLASVVATWFFARHYAFRRRIDIILFSAINIVNLAKVSKEKIDIRYKGQHLENLWILKFVLGNAGNIDITEAMIRREISLCLVEGIQVLDVEIVSQSAEMDVRLVFDDEKISLQPTYLPRRSTAAFQAIVHATAGRRLALGIIAMTRGVIENTGIRFEDLRAGVVTGAIGSFRHFVVRHRKLVKNVYWVLTSLVIAGGLGTMLLPYLPDLLRLDSSKVETLPPSVGLTLGVVFLVFGLFLLSLTLTLHRLMRFQDLFGYENEDEHGR